MTSAVEFETSPGRLSAHCTQMKLQWTTQIKLQWTISEFSQSLFQSESKCEILGMIISCNFSMNRSPSDGASISHTIPWSQPFPEYIYK